MKVTERGNLNHRKLRNEGEPQRVSAEQREDADGWEPRKMTETDSMSSSF